MTHAEALAAAQAKHPNFASYTPEQRIAAVQETGKVNTYRYDLTQLFADYYSTLAVVFHNGDTQIDRAKAMADELLFKMYVDHPTLVMGHQREVMTATILGAVRTAELDDDAMREFHATRDYLEDLHS